MPVSVKNHCYEEEDMQEDKLSELRIRGRRAVSAADLQGKGLPQCFFSDTGMVFISLEGRENYPDVVDTFTNAVNNNENPQKARKHVSWENYNTFATMKTRES